MKNSYCCMYLVPVEIYEKLLDCLDSKDINTVKDLNRSELGNEEGAFPDLPPPPPPLSPFNLNNMNFPIEGQLGDVYDPDNPRPGPSGQNNRGRNLNVSIRSTSPNDSNEGTMLLNPSSSLNNIKKNVVNKSASNPLLNSENSLQNKEQNLNAYNPSHMTQSHEDITNALQAYSNQIAQKLSKLQDNKEGKKYECVFCHLFFPNIPALTIHLQNVHNSNKRVRINVQGPVDGNIQGPVHENIQGPALENIQRPVHDNVHEPSAQQKNIFPLVQSVAQPEKFIPSSVKPAIMPPLIQPASGTPHNVLIDLNNQAEGNLIDMDTEVYPVQQTSPLIDNNLISSDVDTGRKDQVFKFTAMPLAKKNRKKHMKPRIIIPEFIREDSKSVKRKTKYENWSKKSKSVLDSEDESMNDQDEDEVLFMPLPSNTDKHEDIQKKICSLCGSDFNEQKTLDRHIRNVHGADSHYKQVEPQGVKRKTQASKIDESMSNKKQSPYLYKCKLCSAFFNKENSLERHVKNIHGADKNYHQDEAQGLKRKLESLSCEYCSKVFKTKKSLNNHLDKFHKSDLKHTKNDYDSWK